MPPIRILVVDDSVVIRKENAYQASAQITSVIDTLMQTTINMVSGA